MIMEFWSLDVFFDLLQIEEVYNLFSTEFNWERGSFDIIKGVFKDGSFHYYLDPPTDLNEEDVRVCQYQLIEKFFDGEEWILSAWCSDPSQADYNNHDFSASNEKFSCNIYDN